MDTDKSGTLQHPEFIEALQRLHLGLSTKEIAQLFYAMDASGDGILQLSEFQEAIEGGAVNPLKDWADQTFQKIAKTLLVECSLQICQKYAVKPELKSMT